MAIVPFHFIFPSWRHILILTATLLLQVSRNVQLV